MKRTFLSHTGNLSLWEVAHRWAGIHPEDTSETKLPIEVKDILFTMMRAQIASDLKVGDSEGILFRDATFYAHWTEFVPFHDQNWDGTPEHKRILYLQATNANLARHDEYIQRHHDILSGKKPINKKYLCSVHVDRDNLAEWSCKHDLPFPSFWFSEEERAEIETEWQKYGPVLAEINAIHARGEAVSVEMEESILKQFGIPADEDSSFRKRKLTQQDIDYFWSVRMEEKQQIRILARHAAKQLWAASPERTITDICEDNMILKFCGAEYYNGKGTIHNWIKDLDPRSANQKRGPKTKK